VPFFRHRVPVDVNPFQHLILAAALAARREHGNLVASIKKRASLLPHPPVKGNRQVLHDDKNLFFHDRCRTIATCKGRRARKASSPVPSAGGESYWPTTGNIGDSRNSRIDPACSRSSTPRPLAPAAGFPDHGPKRTPTCQSPGSCTGYRGGASCNRSIWAFHPAGKRSSSSMRIRSA